MQNIICNGNKNQMDDFSYILCRSFRVKGCLHAHNYYYLPATSLHPPKQKKSNPNSAPEHASYKFKNQQIARAEKKYKFKRSRFLNFTFIMELWNNIMLLSMKTEEATLYYSPDGQMVKVSVSIPVSMHAWVQTSSLGQLNLFFH